jgi:hypothetical protein
MAKKKRATGQGPFKKAEYYFKAACVYIFRELSAWNRFADKNRYRAEINAQIRDVDNPRNWTQSTVVPSC